MRVLVTGANGFLGRRVVEHLLASGHGVRALIRPPVCLDGLGWESRVELHRGDLLDDPKLSEAFEEIDAVVHLAASMSGSERTRYEETVRSTECLFEAMSGSAARRLVLCSSFSVYDWLSATRIVDEKLALLELPGRDAQGYGPAKRMQEHLAWERSGAHEWDLTVLRPGFIWGRGNEIPPGSIGRDLGPLRLVFSPGRRLPFTHVDNCAEFFCAVLENRTSAGLSINVVDSYELTAWQYMGEALRRGASGGVRVPLPYWLLRGIASPLRIIAGVVFGSGARLPSLIRPAEIAQLCRPFRYSTRTLTELLGWSPPFDLAECLDRTFDFSKGVPCDERAGDRPHDPGRPHP